MEIVDYLLARKKAGSDVTIEQLSVTENGTYSEQDIAYSPVVVNVPTPENSYQLTDIPTGAVSTIEDGTDLPMSSLKVDIEPVQDLHGYDHPWAGGAGKNKCNAQNPIVLSQADNIGNQPCTIPAGTYTYSWTSSENTAISLTLFNDSTQIGSFASPTAIQGRGNLTFTISENATHLRCYYNGATTVSDIQVESGATATSYEPYSNICPISGWTAANVTRSGKNLYKVELDNYYLDTVTGLPVAEPGYEVSKFIPISANQSIYIPQSDSARRWFYDKFKNPKTYLQNSDNQIYTAQEDGYIRITLNKKASLYSTYQIEYGTEATTYEPYNGTTYTIEFRDGDNPLTVYGGTLDVTTGELVVTKGYMFFDGSNDEEWMIYNNPGFKVNQLYVNNISNIASSTGISEGNTLCDKFKSISIDDRNGNFNACYAARNGICFNIKDFTIEMWKNWLADNNVAVAYTFETPATYHLTPTQIRTLVGNNNIWADTGDVLSGKYFKEL